MPVDCDWRIGKHLEDEWKLFKCNILAFNKEEGSLTGLVISCLGTAF